MMKTTLFATCALAAGTSVASAGGKEGTIGLGAEYDLVGVGGVGLDYDAGKLHVGGMLGYRENGRNTSLFEIGAHIYYHVHETPTSDFGVGGGFALASIPPTPNVNRATDVFVEPGFQIRAFVTQNVALSFTGALVLGTADASGVAVAGQTVSSSLSFLNPAIGFSGGAGVHYYFF